MMYVIIYYIVISTGSQMCKSYTVPTTCLGLQNIANVISVFKRGTSSYADLKSPYPTSVYSVYTLNKTRSQ